LGCLLLFFYFSYIVDFCLSSCISSPAPSLIPRPDPSPSSGAAVCTESHDSECTISEVVVRETVASDEHAAAESPTLGMMLNVAVGPSEEVAGAYYPGCHLGPVIVASASVSSCCPWYQ
jgi:hypothetical protein